MSNVRAITPIVLSFELTLIRVLLLGVFHEIVEQLFLAFLTKLLPTLSKVLLILQTFRPEFKKLLDVIFAHSRRNVDLFGEVKVRPQSLLPQRDDPDTQVVSRVLVYPLWRFDHWLARSSVASYELNWL